MILLLDNFDSFVWNLARYVRELGGEPLVRRSDAITLEEIAELAPTHLIVSPGPCTPMEAGVSVAAIRRFGALMPVLGVCLGHQAVGAAYGARIVRAGQPMHGKASAIRHDGTGLFAGIPNPFQATRYHSLVVERQSLPPDLLVTAISDDDEIMALRHRTHRVVGTQFHPESVLTEHGHALVGRFLEGGW